MTSSNHNDDLFSASLESVSTSKRADKFQRFKNDFQRECEATLNNAQEWIKAELPIVTEYIDPALIKDELKQSKTSERRKYLLSALLFEKSLRESISSNDAKKAAVMALHMVNNMWQAKAELHGLEPVNSVTKKTEHSAIQTHNDAREKILTSLIEKGEKLKRESQILEKQKTKTHKVQTKKSEKTAKPSPVTRRKADLWTQEAEKARLQKRFENVKPKKAKKKSNSVFSKVKTKIPLKRKNKGQQVEQVNEDKQVINKSPEDSLLDDPNRSSIMVSPGFADSIDDSLIQARAEIFKDDPNASGVKVHKMLKQREHERQEPGSNTIIMKLASSTGKRSGAKLSIPEQCQDAINMLTEQFPGYDMVAIRNMAAAKVGVSPQYIENLNILPEKTG